MFARFQLLAGPALPRPALLLIGMVLLLFGVSAAHGQQQQEDPAAIVARIRWTVGPARVPVGSMAQLDLPAGYRFADAEGARLFNQLNQNPSDGSELGVILPETAFAANAGMSWYIMLHYQDIGYVKDDEKDSLDSATTDAILESIRRATEQENQQRIAMGWAPMTVIGWNQPPFYDPQTHHLTWAIEGGQQGQSTINYNSRLLGRGGVISANMVIGPEGLTATVPTYRMLAGNLSFNAGQRYQEFRSGDKVAQYGLVGLMTGGAAVVAVKAWKGFAKIGAVVLGLLAAGLAKLKAMFGGRAAPSAASAGAGVSGGSTATETGAEATVVKCAVCGQANRVRPSGPGADHPRCARCKASLSV